jgi:toxin ParE1/3/4
MAYIHARNPVAARKTQTTIVERVGLLGRFPMVGRRGSESGTREILVHPSYMIIYRATDTQVTILRVIHTARQR